MTTTSVVVVVVTSQADWQQPPHERPQQGEAPATIS